MDLAKHIRVPAQPLQRTKPLSHSELETRIRVLETLLDEVAEMVVKDAAITDEPNNAARIVQMIDQAMGRRP